MENDPIALSSSNLNDQSRYFQDEAKSLCINNISRIIINRIRTKFDNKVKGTRGNIDILMTSETKLDASFLTSKFLINGYTCPYRLDQNAKGGYFPRIKSQKKELGYFLFIESTQSTNLLANGKYGHMERLLTHNFQKYQNPSIIEYFNSILISVIFTFLIFY